MLWPVNTQRAAELKLEAFSRNFSRNFTKNFHDFRLVIFFWRRDWFSWPRRTSEKCKKMAFRETILFNYLCSLAGFCSVFSLLIDFFGECNFVRLHFVCIHLLWDLDLESGREHFNWIFDWSILLQNCIFVIFKRLHKSFCDFITFWKFVLIFSQ